MVEMRRPSPQPVPGLPEIQFSLGWRTRRCASSRRYWPRKGSTSTTSTSPTVTPCNRRSIVRSSGGDVGAELAQLKGAQAERALQHANVHSIGVE